jgi:DNA-binding NarL/FixJ family response regulator
MCATSCPKRILLVDDFEPWRRWLHSGLAAHAELQIVGEAVNGAEAVQKARELKPDLILLDIGLPDMSGIEVAERIGQMDRCSEIVFVTQNNDPELMSVALAMGAKGYLLKTTAATGLIPAIEGALNLGHQK